MQVLEIRVGLMRIGVPERQCLRTRRLVARLEYAIRTFNELSDQERGEPGDLSHLADAVDALEKLANLGRRMRASRPRKDGAT